MITYGKTSDWPSSAKKIVYRAFNPAPLSLYIGQSINAQCTLSKERMLHVDMVMIYDSNYHFFVIWNTAFHRKLHAGERVTLSIGKECFKKNREAGVIQFISHNLNATNGADAVQEYVIICPENQLYQFCNNIDFYYHQYIREQTTSVEVFRKVDMVQRQRRDPAFREKILKHFNYTCMICGEKEERILEAAHIVSVKENGNDSISNGVCLCANHHIMYDSALIDINFEKKTFDYSGDSALQSSWYIEAKKRDFKLFLNQ